MRHLIHITSGWIRQVLAEILALLSNTLTGASCIGGYWPHQRAGQAFQFKEHAKCSLLHRSTQASCTRAICDLADLMAFQSQTCCSTFFYISCYSYSCLWLVTLILLLWRRSPDGSGDCSLQTLSKEEHISRGVLPDVDGNWGSQHM